MSDPSHRRAEAELFIDMVGVDDHQESVSIEESLTADSDGNAAGADDLSASFDVDEEDEDED